MTSWTGIESQRREQGTCAAPRHEPNTIARFTIPASVPREIQRISETNWRPFRTRRELGFNRYESAKDGYVVFREEGYLIRVAWRFIRRNTTT